VIIDTGAPDKPAAAAWGRIDACNVLMAGIADALPEQPAEAALSAAIVSAILGEMHDSKMMATVRRTLLTYWPIISSLAETDPAGFDELLLAYAELTTCLPEDRSEAIARRKASAQLR
jgi:hypothetical protein